MSDDSAADAVEWDSEGRLKDGLKARHRRTLRVFLLVGAGLAALGGLVGGFKGLEGIGWAFYLAPAGLLLIAAAITVLVNPRVTIDRKAEMIRYGGQTIPFDAISSVETDLVVRHIDKTNETARSLQLEVVDEQGHRWTVEQSRKEQQVERMAELLRAELRESTGDGVVGSWKG